MKRIVMLVPLLLTPAGCSSLFPVPEATTGWSFQVGTPAVVHTAAIVQQTGGIVSAVPLAGGPIGALSATPARLAAEPCLSSSPLAPRASLAPAECDINDVCRRLDAVERRLSQPRAEELPPPRKLPAGPSTPGGE